MKVGDRVTIKGEIIDCKPLCYSRDYWGKEIPEGMSITVQLPSGQNFYVMYTNEMEGVSTDFVIEGESELAEQT